MPCGKSSGCQRHVLDGHLGTQYFFLSITSWLWYEEFCSVTHFSHNATLQAQSNKADSGQSTLNLWPKTYLCSFKVSYLRYVYSNRNSINSCTEHSLGSSESSFYSPVYKPSQLLPHTSKKAHLLLHPCVSMIHKSTYQHLPYVIIGCLSTSVTIACAPIGKEPSCVDLDIPNMMSHKAQ